MKPYDFTGFSIPEKDRLKIEDECRGVYEKRKPLYTNPVFTGEKVYGDGWWIFNANPVDTPFTYKYFNDGNLPMKPPFRRIQIHFLDPHGEIPLHQDMPDSDFGHNIAITQPDGCEFRVLGTVIPFKAGDYFKVQTGSPHSVHNNSDELRIHILPKRYKHWCHFPKFSKTFLPDNKTKVCGANYMKPVSWEDYDKVLAEFDVGKKPGCEFCIDKEKSGWKTKRIEVNEKYGEEYIDDLRYIDFRINEPDKLKEAITDTVQVVKLMNIDTKLDWASAINKDLSFFYVNDHWSNWEWNFEGIKANKYKFAITMNFGDDVNDVLDVYETINEVRPENSLLQIYFYTNTANEKLLDDYQFLKSIMNFDDEIKIYAGGEFKNDPNENIILNRRIENLLASESNPEDLILLHNLINSA